MFLKYNMFSPKELGQIAEVVGKRLRVTRRCVLVGVAGPQGSGKSTISTALSTFLRSQDIETIVLSLDDFYYPHAYRESLSQAVHPLLATRGVPGTHDIECLSHTLNMLMAGAAGDLVKWPKFIKSLDDRESSPVSTVLSHKQNSRVVILEGWCIGCLPSERLEEAVNELESRMDPFCEWRRYVNAQIISRYKPVWDKLDLYVYLQVPSWDCVIRWRGEQAIENGEQFSSNELLKFIEHFERISRAMFTDEGRMVPDVIVKLTEHHKVSELVIQQ